MHAVDLVLYVVAAVCLALAIIPTLQAVAARLIAAGLLAWVMVALIATARA